MRRRGRVGTAPEIGKARVKMGLRSRVKGKTFELVVRSRVAQFFPDVTVRRSSQAERAYEADLIIEGPRCPAWLSSLWFECEHANHVDPLRKLEQGERDALAFANRMGRERMPVACTRETGRRTIYATLRMVTLLKLVLPRQSIEIPESAAEQPINLPLDDLLADLAKRTW